VYEIMERMRVYKITELTYIKKINQKINLTFPADDSIDEFDVEHHVGHTHEFPYLGYDLTYNLAHGEVTGLQFSYS